MNITADRFTKNTYSSAVTQDMNALNLEMQNPQVKWRYGRKVTLAEYKWEDAPCLNKCCLPVSLGLGLTIGLVMVVYDLARLIFTGIAKAFKDRGEYMKVCCFQIGRRSQAMFGMFVSIINYKYGLRHQEEGQFHLTCYELIRKGATNPIPAGNSSRQPPKSTAPKATASKGAGSPQTVEDIWKGKQIKKAKLEDILHLCRPLPSCPPEAYNLADADFEPIIGNLIFSAKMTSAANSKEEYYALAEALLYKAVSRGVKIKAEKIVGYPAYPFLDKAVAAKMPIEYLCALAEQGHSPAMSLSNLIVETNDDIFQLIGKASILEKALLKSEINVLAGMLKGQVAVLKQPSLSPEVRIKIIEALYLKAQPGFDKAYTELAEYLIEEGIKKGENIGKYLNVNIDNKASFLDTALAMANMRFGQPLSFPTKPDRPYDEPTRNYIKALIDQGAKLRKPFPGLKDRLNMDPELRQIMALFFTSDGSIDHTQMLRADLKLKFEDLDTLHFD